MTITTGLVDTSSTPRLMNLVSAGKLDPLVFVTHRFALEQAEDVVSRAIGGRLGREQLTAESWWMAGRRRRLGTSSRRVECPPTASSGAFVVSGSALDIQERLGEGGPGAAE